MGRRRDEEGEQDDEDGDYDCQTRGAGTVDREGIIKRGKDRDKRIVIIQMRVGTEGPEAYEELGVLKTLQVRRGYRLG